MWVGTRQPLKEPFHVFIGGSPARKGDEVVPASIAILESTAPDYQLKVDTPEGTRRTRLADWIVDPQNPLTARVLVNRIWHYHFGTGIVDTPNDFGYMGGRPTHPELLDFLAARLIEGGWRIKSIHKLIMMSETYRQSSRFRTQAAAVDGDARWLWRFPPRRLSAEEIRDTMLNVAYRLPEHGDRLVPDGGPGFRLYKYLQDNVATYVPLDRHGPETYRRAVYHQNARASRTDLMTDFDQPDCAFSAPRRVATTTPLQALTMLNHSFTLEMAAALSERVQSEAENQAAQIKRVYQLCYSRNPTDQEARTCSVFVDKHGLAAFCRVLLNTSELIYVE